MPDRELLREYASSGSEAAFGRIVERHARMVHGACFRILGDRHAAEDAVQATFLVLVRKARSLPRDAVLGGWLFRTAQHAALHIRDRLRRQAAREKEAAAMKEREPSTAPEAAWAALRPQLDAALAALPAAQRDAIVLRYLGGLSEEQVAAETSVPRSTVSMRVERGLERLRERFHRQGVSLSVAGLAGGLGRAALEPAPTGLAELVRTACLGQAQVSPLAAEAAKGVEQAMLVTKLKVWAAAILLLGAAGAGAGLALGQSAPEPAKPLPPPPFEFKWLPGWKVEHVAFTWGNSGKPLGGASRWAVGGGTISACYPADHAESGRIYFVDKRRHVWLMDKDQIWLVAGTDDLGYANGPAEYAQFCGGGVYGGGIPGVVATGYTAYISDGGLRRISRGTDGRWKVELAGGKGKKGSLAPGETANFSDLAGIGQLTGDAKGNLYFVLGGGLAKANPDGKVTMIISREKVNADLAAIYAKKWPDAPKPGNIALGSGEGCNLTVGSDGAIYGGGRTWPSAWKVTPDGTFVPLVNYAPKDKMVGGKRWGPFEPATYEPHCCMGWAVTPDGYVLMMNEIPWALSRCEFDKNQVTVMMPDGSFALDGKPWNPPASFGLLPDGSHACNAPGPFPSRSTWIRMRKEK